MDEFNDLVERRKLNMNILLKNFDKDWLGPVGSPTSDHLLKYLPPPRDDTLILIFGHRNFVADTRKLCQEHGHKNILS